MFSPVLPSASVNFSAILSHNLTKTPIGHRSLGHPAHHLPLRALPSLTHPEGQAPNCSFHSSKAELGSWVRVLKAFVILLRVIASRAEESHDLLSLSPRLLDD